MAKKKVDPRDRALPLLGDRVTIPVSQIEFTVGGSTLWVQSPVGATVLRIKFPMGIRVDQCRTEQPVSHMDVTIHKGDIGSIPPTICLADDYE